MNELFNTQSVIKQFNQAADSYDQAAVLQRNTADQLLERLQLIKLVPKTIVDLGAGTGYLTSLLRGQYPSAHIVALDPAQQSLAKITAADIKTVVARAESIPLADNSVDLVVSNMMLHWSEDIPAIFAEIKRILSPDGLMLFSTLGPDTLYELRASWAQVDEYNHVHHFYDMHDLGDALLGAGFKDPVMDMNKLTIQYQQLPDLFKDFKQLGVRNRAEPLKRGLTTRGQWQKMLDGYERFKQDSRYPATYECIFGHAWGRVDQRPGEFSIPIDQVSGLGENR